MDSLAALGTEMKACRLCLTAGFFVQPPAVFAHSELAEVLLIGQAPGVTEVEAQRPFNAGSGRRLFQWLGEAGWDEAEFRTHQAMTAVTKCYPGKDKNGKGDRVPTREEQAFCRPFLEREITLIRPRLIILVGGLAIKLLFPKSAKLRDVVGTAVYFPPETLTNPVNFNLKQGQIYNEFDGSMDRNGRWVVPLPHPSGASLWPNKPANQERIRQAIILLAAIRQNWNLK